MISWTFTPNGTIPGSSRHCSCEVMTNQAGVMIGLWGWSYSSGRVRFDYWDRDIVFGFGAKAVRHGYSEDEDWIRILGPTCEVSIVSSQLSRPLSAEEGLAVADNIRSCLLEYERFVVSKAPFPAEVIFDRFSKESLKLDVP